MRTMTPHYKRIAQIKLRGKKSCNLSCGCCVTMNHKEEIIKSLLDSEMKQETLLQDTDKEDFPCIN